MQIHFIWRRQVNVTNVTSHNFNKFQMWRLFLSASAGYWKRCGRWPLC